MRLSIIITYFLFGITLQISAIEASFERINTELGLGSNIARWTYQDKDGFIWISTKVGLSRYDGYVLKNYYTSNSKTGSLKDIVIGYPIETDNNYLLFSSAKGIIGYNKNLDNFTYYAGKQNEYYNTRFLTPDNNGNLWVAKENVGFFKLNCNPDSISTITVIDGKEKGYQMRKAQMIHTANNGDVWLFSLDFIAVVRNTTNKVEYIKNWGITYNSIHEHTANNMVLVDGAGYFHHLNSLTLKITQYDNNFFNERDISHNFKCVFIGKNKVLGVSRKEGLFYLNHNFKQHKVTLIKNYKKQAGIQNALTSNNLRHIFIDKTNMAWLATDGGGVCYFNLDPTRFSHIKYGQKNNGLSDSYISALYEDNNNNLWISVWQSHINILPANNKYNGFKYLKNKNITTGKSKGYESVASFAEMKKDGAPVMLLGTSNYRLLKDYSKLNFENPEIDLYASDTLMRNSKIESYLVDDDKYLWICRSEEGIERHTLDKKGNVIESYLFNEQAKFSKHFEKAGQCYDILKDKKGVIWVLNESRLFRINNTPNKPSIQPINLTGRMQMMHEDKNGNLWIVTKGNGLLKVRFNAQGKLISKHNFNTKNGFADDYFYSIAEDKQGNLWIAANVGLIKMNPDTEKHQVFGISDGINGKNFVERCCIYRRNGEMVFGTTNGLYVFRPEEITHNSYKPKTQITGFYIFDKEVTLGEEVLGKIILPKNITRTNTIEVPYQAHVLAFEFAALQSNSPKSNKFSYKLEGFDKDWRNTNAKSRKVTYTNLREGEYTFWVKSANNDGLWDDTPAKIKLIIKPPYWRTTLAYFIYIIIAIALFLVIRAYYLNRLRMKQALEMERFEKSKIEELSQMKMRFFTNISHEFRTPLSLIKASFDSLSDEYIKTSKHKDKAFIDTAKRNISILLRLVNQLIDVRRFDQGKMKIKKENTELVSFINETAKSFQVMAHKKGIAFNYQSSLSEIYVNIDPDLLEKVIYNLLSNAFKHTLKGGEITIEIINNDSRIEIIVKDTGKGISLEHQNFIFERFYQGEKVKTENMGSSGIGLSLTKDFVELHNGLISFTSKEGEGTTFIVNLPKTSSDLSKDETSENKSSKRILFSNLRTSKDIAKNSNTERKTLLIVEDNYELRDFLVQSFSDSYNVIEAEDGKVGIEKCISPGKIDIDLVISDVMMPLKDGYELCEEIKGNMETSHIPIILLTAKTTDEHKLEGFEKGADAYIEKPFSIDILKAQVHSILESKKKVQDYYNRNITTDIDKKEAKSDSQTTETIKAKSSSAISEYDIALLTKIKTTIKQKMADPMFSVEVLASECAVSDSTLRRKVKALTGSSPSHLIRRFKIQYAATLLKKETYTVYDAMHEAGFSNYANFSKLFVKEFEASPGEFRKQYHSSIKN